MKVDKKEEEEDDDDDDDDDDDVLTLDSINSYNIQSYEILSSSGVY